VNQHVTAISVRFASPQLIMGIGRGSSSSKYLEYIHSSNTKKGHINVEKTLNRKGVRDFQAAAHAKLDLKIASKFSIFILTYITKQPIAMNKEECLAYNAACDIPDDGYVNQDGPMAINDVLDGTMTLNLSHAGGEFQNIIEEEICQQSS
jgi:hypothetical protein